MLCPRDLKPCIDDCCNGGCVLTGEQTIEVCSACNCPMVDGISGAGFCSCDWDDEDFFEEDL